MQLSFHNAGDFAPNGDYIGPARVNQSQVLVRLPVTGWQGPEKAAPRWDWSRVQVGGELIADPSGYGSPHGPAVAPDDSVAID